MTNRDTAQRVFLSVAKDGDVKTQEQGNSSQSFQVMFYHVVDKQGTHRFLTMNSLATEMMGGIDVFKTKLAQQFKSYELLGTTSVSVSENGREGTILDPRGAEQLRNCILSAMAAYPNSCHYLEPWIPNSEKSAGPVPAARDSVQLRPMSTFKKEVGKVDLERVALVFQDNDLREVVKPEFVDAAAARGGAQLNELKDHVRAILEPEMTRAIEGPNYSPEPPPMSQGDK